MMSLSCTGMHESFRKAVHICERYENVVFYCVELCAGMIDTEAVVEVDDTVEEDQ